MAYPQYQLSDARNDAGIRAVSGVCNDSVKFKDQINAVTRQLMKRGGWFGLEVLTRFCVYSGCITLPRMVGTLLGARNCGGMAEIRNNWWGIVGPGDYANWNGSYFGNYSHGVMWNGGGSGVTIRDDGTAPTYNDISGTLGKKLAYHVVKNADIGKAITFYGFEYGGQPLQTKLADGTWREGVTITASSAGGAVLPAMTTQNVTKITSVVREATSGLAYLYEYGPDANNVNALRDLAVYEPNETNPMYRRVHVLGCNPIGTRVDGNGQRIGSLECMVKLEFIPLVNDNDFLLIDDFDALRYGVQALKKDEAGDAEGAEGFWMKSLRELNYRDRDKSPGQQISVRVRVDGGACLTNPV